MPTSAWKCRTLTSVLLAKCTDFRLKIRVPFQDAGSPVTARVCSELPTWRPGDASLSARLQVPFSRRAAEFGLNTFLKQMGGKAAVGKRLVPPVCCGGGAAAGPRCCHKCPRSRSWCRGLPRFSSVLVNSQSTTLPRPTAETAASLLPAGPRLQVKNASVHSLQGDRPLLSQTQKHTHAHAHTHTDSTDTHSQAHASTP